MFSSKVYAQTVDLSTWQTGATGLRTTSNVDQKTAGLTTIINASGIPFINLHGGVKDRGWNTVTSSTAVDLGEIKIPGINPTLVSESADWSHNEMTFSNNLKLWISRLSPATLIQNQNSSLRLFSGNLNGATITQGPAWNPNQVTNRTASPSYPKYIAYSSGGSTQVQAIPASGTTALSLPALDNDWVMVWYGNNSHFTEAKTPITYNLPHDQSYQADVPILLKFENNPTSIIQSPEGGIDLTFSTNSGYTSILPLFGREHPQASDTEGWGSSETLPANVSTKINFWNSNNRLCSYPTNVSENYSYDTNTDTSTVSENITFLSVCSGGSASAGFSIMPPMMALTLTTPDQQGNTNPLNIQVSGGSPAGGLTNANYPTEFGPILGIDNTNTYSWSITGLKKYTDSKRILTNTGTAPPQLVQELQTEVQKIIDAGHFQPWIFSDKMPRREFTGQIYFLNPADTIMHLTDIASTLPDNIPQKAQLINYLQTERAAYPPETVYNLPLDSGTVRTPFALDGAGASSLANRTVYEMWELTRPEVFLKRVPLHNFYALADYYDLTKEDPAATMTSAKTVLDNDLKEQDWATMYWFKGYEDGRVATINANKEFAGLVGFIRLAQLTQDQQAEILGRQLLSKAAVSRLAMTIYPRFLYANNILTLPSDPTWMARYTAGDWYGFLTNYNWATSYDDHRQVTVLDQFGVFLWDDEGYPTSQLQAGISSYLSAYHDMVPELFRFLVDKSKQDIEIYLNKAKTFFPHWFMAYSQGELGAEHNLMRPADSYQLFMASNFIQNESPRTLEKYLDNSWLDTGDLFYMQKLAETIKAYQGWEWEDQTYLAADINQDHVVDLNDLNLLFGNWNSPRDLRADLSSDGLVNGIDFGLLVKDWGKIK